MLNKNETRIAQNWSGDFSKPLVTINCCTYNHEKYIEKAIKGFLMQKTRFPFEIVIHDDASTDQTVQIVNKYAEMYPNIIKPIYEHENQYSKGKKYLTDTSNPYIRGKYVAICEGDDFWTNPLKLQMQMETLENHPECSVVFNKVMVVNKDEESSNVYMPAYNSIKAGIVTLEDMMQEEFVNLRVCFHTSSIFYRADIFNLYFEDFQKKFTDAPFPFGDIMLKLFFLTQWNGLFIDEVCGCYRLDSGGYTSNIEKNKSKRIEHACMFYSTLERFDEVYSYKYHKYILNKLRDLEYIIDRENKDIKKIFYYNYGARNDNYKMKAIMYILFPELYAKIRKTVIKVKHRKKHGE